MGHERESRDPRVVAAGTGCAARNLDDMAEEELPPWRPLGVRGDAGAEAEYAALDDGVPPWLERSLWSWVVERTGSGGLTIERAERLLRQPMPGDEGGGLRLYWFWEDAGPSDRLALVDAVLFDLWERVGDADPRAYADEAVKADRLAALVKLDRMLKEGGSAWRLGVQPRWGLERRVDETMQRLATEVTEAGTDAARTMAAAWRACYGLQPDHDKAYTLAVKAVEAAVLPLTSAKDGQATLGKAITHIADTRRRWTVGGLDDERQQSADTLLAMLRSLWHSQERHAGNDGTIRGVSAREGEAAVSLAATLVHWFTKGVVAKS